MHDVPFRIPDKAPHVVVNIISEHLLGEGIKLGFGETFELRALLQQRYKAHLLYIVDVETTVLIFPAALEAAYRKIKKDHLLLDGFKSVVNELRLIMNQRHSGS